MYTKIASFYVHFKGSGAQGSIVSEFLVQTRDDDGDNDDDYKTMIKKPMEGR